MLIVGGGHRANECLRNLFLSANTIRDGYLPKKGWEGGGGRQSKTSVLATIFHREGIVAMAGRVEVGLKQIIFRECDERRLINVMKGG